MYVDESGDPGALQKFSSKHYILSGIIIFSDEWLEALHKLKDLRKSFRGKYGIGVRVEIHGAELFRVHKLEAYRGIPKHKRLALYHHLLESLPEILPGRRIINICLKKEDFRPEVDFQDVAWRRLIQRFDMFLIQKGEKKGMIISDWTDEKKIRKILRRMRVFNPIPSHFQTSYQVPTTRIIEDITLRTSQDSYFIQLADVVAHALYRQEFPKASLKKFNADHLFRRLDPILLKKASRNDPQGIVRK